MGVDPDAPVKTAAIARNPGHRVAASVEVCMRRFIWKGFLAFPVLVGIGFLLFHTQDVSSQSFTGPCA